MTCPDCGHRCFSTRGLAQHRIKKHGFQGAATAIRERATAVVAWWDVLDARDPGDPEAVELATREMDKRVNALREALER